MLGGFKPKARSFPDLTPEMHHASDETIRWCLAQVGAFVEGKVHSCPEIGSPHDERVGAYAHGFLVGYLQVTGADRRWANGDIDTMDAGLTVLSQIVLMHLFGPTRAADVHSYLLSYAGVSSDLIALDQLGGSDGMAHAAGREKRFGGRLLRYLEQNVYRPSISINAIAKAKLNFQQLVTEELGGNWPDGGGHSLPAASTQAGTRDPLPNLADLGSRIEAARAKHAKRT